MSRSFAKMAGGLRRHGKAFRSVLPGNVSLVARSTKCWSHEGGWAFRRNLGASSSGWGGLGTSSILLCEIAAAARAVLANRFAGADCCPDVTKLRSLPSDVELLLAGFPCQDLSQAGMTAGIDGDRSSLVHHVFRLLDDHPIPWVILENVSFMLHLGRGKALRVIVDALEDRGYRWAYRVINSLAFVHSVVSGFFLWQPKQNSIPPMCS